MSSSGSGRAAALLRLHPPWVVAVAAAGVHASGIAGGYVLDDVPAILRHPVVQGIVPLTEAWSREFWGAPLGAGWSSSWRPLTTLSFAWVHRVFAEAWAQHLVNVGLWALACALATRLAGRFLAPGTALVAGLVFAVLPVHVENVASLVGRADVLALCGSVLAVEFALPRDRRPPSLARVALAILAYLCALLSKETAALVPLTVAWLSLLARRSGVHTPPPPPGWAASLAPAGALGVAGLGYLAVRHHLLPVGLPAEFVGADNQLHDLGGVARWVGNLGVLGRAARLTLWPDALCSDHTYADTVVLADPWTLGSMWAVVGAALILVACADGVRAWRGTSPGLGLATLVAWVLVGHWVIDLSVVLAERLLLWPSLWFVFAVVHRVAAVSATKICPEGRVVAAGFVVVLAAGRTVIYTDAWRSPISLHQASVEACPAAVHNRFNLAEELRREGRPVEAVWHYGVAAAGRSAFPGVFDIPAFAAERDTPIVELLPRLPQLCGASDARAFWAGLHQFLRAHGALAEAEVVAMLATEGAVAR